MALQQQLARAYEHIQASASTSWTVVHGLGIYPTIDVFIDYQGEKHKILPLAVTYVDKNTCTISFSVARTGMAVAS